MTRVHHRRGEIGFYLRWALVRLSLVTALLSGISEFSAFGSISQYPPTGIGFGGGELVLGHFVHSSGDAPLNLNAVEVPLLFVLGVFTNHFYEFHLATIPLPTYDGWELHVNLWTIAILLLAYPATTFVLARVSLSRRRRRGLCLNCGYDLRGNVSGQCSECGERDGRGIEQPSSSRNDPEFVERLQIKACDRRPLLWILAILAVSMETLAIVSYYRPSEEPGLDGTAQWGIWLNEAWLGVWRFARSDSGADEISQFELPYMVRYIHFTESGVTYDSSPSAAKFDHWGLALYMWPLVALLGAYPAYAVTLELIRIITRRRRGLCGNCGYDLRGNDSGRCPECGNRFDPRTIPRDTTNHG